MKNYFTTSIHGTFKVFALVFVMLSGALHVGAQISVTATAGTPGPTLYATLQLAIAAVNAGTHQGAITLSVIGTGTAETVQSTLNSSGTGSALYTSILIKPAPSTTPIISGSFGTNAAVLKLNGADNVTIDGSNSVGGTTRDLTFKNTNSAASAATAMVIWIASASGTDGATHDTVENCNITGNSATTTGFGIFGGGTTNTTTAATAANSNNVIQNNAITSVQNGFMTVGFGTAPFDQNWIVRQNTETTIGFRGIALQNASNLTIDDNSLSNFAASRTTGIGVLLGIQIGLGISGGNIFNNNISNINNTGLQFGTAGIYLTATSTASNLNIYNNFINNIWSSQGWTSTTTAPDNGYGIMMDNGGGYNIYYNTVVLSTSASVTGGLTTAALNITAGVTAAASVNLKNNIFINNQTVNNTNRVGILCSASKTIFASIDNNDYIGNTALGIFGATATNTIAAIQSSFGGNTSSISASPAFVSGTDLHLLVVAANVPLVAGAPIGGITTDIDGNTRSGTNPVMGADEISLPSMSYALLPNICVAGDATLTATIGDATTGINTTTFVPQIYFQKNGSGWFHSAGVLSSGTATLGTWTFTISAATMGGLLPLDVVQYYVIAQNNSGFIFSVPGAGLVATSTTSVTSPPTTPNSYTYTLLGGIYHVGVGKTFTTITQAVNVYNTACLTGAVTFLLDDATYPSETYPITVNYNANASAINTLTIKPNTAATPTISASVASGLFFILGNNVTIDGSNNGTNSQNLTINNTNATSTYVIRYGSPSSSIGATSNTIKNCNLNNASNTGSIGVIYFGSGVTAGAVAEAPNSNCIIQNNNITGAELGVYYLGCTSNPDNNLLITGNTISNVGADGIFAAYIQNGNITANNISNVNGNFNPDIEAIIVNGTVTNTNIFNNKISNVHNPTANGAYGIYLFAFGGSSVNVYNNFIWDIESLGSATPAKNGDGIYVGQGSGYNIYHNTINMTTNQTAPAGVPTAIGFAAGLAAGSINLRNNIFVNNMTAGSTQKYAIYNASSNNIFASIDYNDYYTAVGTNLGFQIGNAINIGALRTAFGSNTHSVNVLPPFTSTTDPHINIVACAATQLESGGINVGITTDIDGQTRPGPTAACGGGTSVDIGADEFDGGIADVIPPAITYTNLPNTCSTGDVTLTGVVITDASGVPVSGSTVPQIYFKKNALTYAHASGVKTSGTATNGVWSFTIPAASIPGGTPVTGDVISYFIIAQDIVTPTANVGSNPAIGLVATDVNTVTTPPTTPNTYTIGVTLNGPYHVGVAGADPYHTIGAAITDYNNGCLSGPVTFLLDDATYPTEAFPIQINRSSYANATNVLTIKPNAGVTTTISGAVATNGLIYMFGSQYVTIDGSNNGTTSQNLTIANTSTTGGYVIRMGSPSLSVGANNNTVKNCLLNNGNNTTTSSAAITSGSGTTLATAAESPNSNNTIQNNTITGGAYGLFVSGYSSGFDANWTISNNTMNGLLYRGMGLFYMQNSNVFNNTINAFSGLAAQSVGILFNGNFSNINVFNNKILGISIAGANGAYGMYLIANNGASNVNIYNNFISNINAATGSATIANNGIGMYVAFGTGYNIYYNTINQTLSEAGGTSINACYVSNYTVNGVTAAGQVILKDNVFANSASSGGNRYAIYSADPNGIFSTIDYNDYSSASGNLGFLGSAQTTLAGIQGVFGGNAHSINATPTFNSSTDLHLNPAVPANSALQAGITISSPAITTDIDGDTRATIPVMGADEVHIPPAITYTALNATTCGNGDITLSGVNIVNIQSGLGVPTTGPLMPRVYFKKNASTWNSAAGVLTTGTAQIGTWSFTISAATMAGLADGDVVSYYVIAQDNPVGNIASNPSAGLVATNVNTVTTPPTTPNTTTIGLPTLAALTTNQSFCFNATSAQTANYTYTNIIGTPSQYTLIWTPTAVLTDVATYTPLPGTPGGTFSINVPANTPANTYTGALTIQNTTTTCTNTQTVTLTVNPLPVITFTGQAGAITCASTTVTYTTQTGMTNYIWAYPGAVLNSDYKIISGGTTSSNTVQLQWLKPGSWTVTINYSDTHSCTDVSPVASNPTTVLVPPVAITNNAQMCTTGPGITLSDASTGGTWSSGTTAVANIDVNLGAITPGIQGTTVITYSNGCGTAATITATVNATPTSGAGITGNSQMCILGPTITLSDGATNGTWSSATTVVTVGNTSGVVSPHTQGTTVISYSNGCGTAATITATVNATPTSGAGISGNSQICILGPTITLSDGATNGTWSSVSTTVAVVGNSSGIVTPVAQGTTVISYSNGCGTAATITATVNATPTSGAGITGNSQICILGPTITLSDGATNGTWSSVSTTVAVIGNSSGIVSPIAQGTTVISYSNGCGTAATITATVNATPTSGAGITGNSQVCILGPTITLSDGATNGTWSSATTVVTVDNISGVVSPHTQGTTVISYSNGCGTAATITATVNATPATITGNAQMCATGSPITLVNTSTNGTWSGGTVGIATVTAGTSLTGTVTPGATQGTVTISYSNGCGSAASITATVNASPAAIGGNSQMCAGGSTITLTNTSTNGTWSGGTSSIATVTVGSLIGTVTSGTTQGTTTFSYSNGCGVATSVTATVNALPAPIAGNAPLCANGSTITLTNTSTNGTWSGSVAGVATVNSNTGIVQSGLTAGNVVISYTNGCSPAATVTVTVNALPTIHTFTGGGAYCALDSGVHVGLTLSDPGISYQLYNGTVLDTTVAGTGSAIDFGLYSTPGVYHAIATNTVTLCTNYLSGITISINPLPDTFTVTGGGSYCEASAGVLVGLDSSASGINYQLYLGSSPIGSAKPGTGHPIDFGLQAGAGVYTVMASNAITMCPQAMAGSATVTVIPLPTADTITGGGGYCASDSGVHVGLNSSTAGIIYQLYNGSSPVGTPDTSTGGALDFGLQTNGGIYTIIATDPVTTCSSMMTGSVTVTVNPLPDTFAITGGGSYCAGGLGVHVGLSNSALGISYQLYNGATAAGSALNGTGSTLDFGLIIAAGVYKVVATDTTTHCMNAKNDSTTVTITPIAVTHMQINTGEGAGDTVCGGGAVTFTAQTLNGGTTPHYQWAVNNLNVGTNDSTYTYTPVLHDVIAATMISSAACAVPDTLYDTMRVQIQTPLVPSVFILVTPINTIHLGQTDTLIAIPTNCGSAPRYQWYKNGNLIAGATNAIYISSTFANNDSMSVRVLTSGACGGEVTDNSVIIHVYPAGVIQVAQVASDIKLIPNPNKGAFVIKGTLGSINDEDVYIEVVDMLGQVVYHNKFIAHGGIVSEQIQLSSMLANGMYLLNMNSATENKMFHFVIEQ